MDQSEEAQNLKVVLLYLLLKSDVLFPQWRILCPRLLLLRLRPRGLLRQPHPSQQVSVCGSR